jgi:hypothetical protein
LKTYLRESNEYRTDIFKRKSARVNCSHRRLFGIEKNTEFFDRKEEERNKEKEKKGIHNRTHTQTAEI